jgi:hypothetical protein
MAVFKTVRDYIQPLVYGVTVVLIVTQLTMDEQMKVILALTYAVAQFISIFVTKYAYKLERFAHSKTILHATWILTGIMSIILGLFSHSLAVIIIAMIAFYIALNIRKPYMVQKIGDHSVNEKRASVLSIESQLTSIIIIVLAPLVGVIAEHATIGIMFISLGIVLLIVDGFFLLKKGA